MFRHLTLPKPNRAGDAVCAAESITLMRGGRTLLNQVSLTLVSGKILALLGPNGAGKSTLLSVLSGEVPPDGGTVQFQNRAISEWTLPDLARRRSVLLQENQLMFPFTVVEVVEMGRAPWRNTERADEDEAAIAEAIAAAEITHLAPRQVPSLSGGERARTAFARVMAGRTGVLMLDEPTAALDLKHQEAVLRLLRQRAEAGDAVLVVLHDLNLAAAYADQIALLRDGELVTCDEPAAVITEQIISEVYQTKVEIIPHPRTGQNIVLPLRETPCC